MNRRPSFRGPVAGRAAGRRAAASLAVAALSVAAAGPASAGRVRDQVELLQRDVTALEERLVRMEQQQVEILAALAELRQATGMNDPGRATPADLAARLSSLEEDVRVVFEQQGETNARLGMVADRVDAVYVHQERERRRPLLPPEAFEGLDETGAVGEGGVPGSPFRGAPGSGAGLATDSDPGSGPDGSDRFDGSGGAWATPRDAPTDSLAASPAHSPAGGAGDAPAAGRAGGTPLLDPAEIYEAARSDYARGAYDLAISGFSEFLDLFPSSDLADNAVYWVGESQFAAGRHAEAASSFEAVRRRWPSSDKVPDAEYKRALALLELNRTADGILALQGVRDGWPESNAGRLARQKLQSLGLM